jgi:hypothetical protein
MATSNFSTTILVDNSKEKVFNAINDVRSWWQGEVEGNAAALNDEFSYRVPGIHFSKQKIIEFIPNEKIEWLITDSKLSFVTDQTEWTGTKIVFEISEVNNKTQVRFSHLGLVPEFECYGDCSNAWKKLIEESLLSLITTGKGVNVFG